MIRIYMANCQDQLLREIAASVFKRRDIAQTYALAILAEKENGEAIDWEKVNRAIMERWSRSGLEWIKKLAWSGKAFASSLPARTEESFRGKTH